MDKKKKKSIYARVKKCIALLLFVQLLVFFFYTYLCSRNSEILYEVGQKIFFAELIVWGLEIAFVYFFLIVPEKKLDEELMHFSEGDTYEDFFSSPYMISDGYENAMKRIRHLLDKNDAIELSNRQAEYLALQNQINPHFLYNTLDAIRGDVIRKGMDDIADTIEALSTFFRYTITEVHRLVCLGDEIESAKNYFMIQKYRFGEKLKWKVTYEGDKEQLKGYMVPKLILQPLVENAVFHGIEPKLGNGEIRISVSDTEKRLYIQVEDDGIGMQQEEVDAINDYNERNSPSYVNDRKKGRIAMKNINRRIKLLFGEEYGIHVYSTQNVGTIVKIVLPKRMDKDEKRDIVH